MECYREAVQREVQQQNVQNRQVIEKSLIKKAATQVQNMIDGRNNLMIYGVLEQIYKDVNLSFQSEKVKQDKDYCTASVC